MNNLFILILLIFGVAILAIPITFLVSYASKRGKMKAMLDFMKKEGANYGKEK